MFRISEEIANQLPFNKPANGLKNARDSVEKVSEICALGEHGMTHEHIPLTEELVKLLAEECLASVAQGVGQTMEKDRIGEISARAKSGNCLVIDGSFIVDRGQSKIERCKKEMNEWLMG